MSSLWATQFPDYPSTTCSALCGCVSADQECSRCVCDRVRRGAVHHAFGFKVRRTSERSNQSGKSLSLSTPEPFSDMDVMGRGGGVLSFRQRWLLHKNFLSALLTYGSMLTQCVTCFCHIWRLVCEWEQRWVTLWWERCGAILHDFFALGSSLSW